MKLKYLAGLVCILIIAVIANAETVKEAAVKKLVEPLLGDGVKVTSVIKTPYAGLYEVRVGRGILYTDEKAHYIFQGDVIDTQTRTSYTRARLNEINKVNFSELPLASSVTMVHGNGKNVIAIFEDPNCGYCKLFRHTLQGMDNITVHTFMYNILAEDSIVKSRNVWCSADRAKTWDDWMLNGTAPSPAAEACVDPNETVLALGQSLGINTTPTIIFSDGTRTSGALEAEALTEKFSSMK